MKKKRTRPTRRKPEPGPVSQKGPSRQRALILAGMVAAGIVGVAVYGIFTDPNIFPDTTEKTLYISRGQTLSSVADSLEAKGIIRSRLLFMFVETVMGGATRPQSGKYIFGSGVSNIELLSALREKKGAVLIPVVIPEGLLARTHAQILSREVGVDSVDFMDLVMSESFARSLGVSASSLEGYLMPGRYNFPWQPVARDVIRRMVAEFTLFYDDSLRAMQDSLGMTTHEIITLASIVEGEAIFRSEMRRIAGVYHNRLRRRMKLQADPTIQYMIEDGPRRIFYADLRQDNPYNTYRRAGLPPGPVNNPGHAAILAALQPEKHTYLFFVANRRWGHWFATNFRDHQRNVRKYRGRGIAVRSTDTEVAGSR
jgi:UPF0755 protein